MKSTAQISALIKYLANVKKIRGENRWHILFYKNWGHGKASTGQGALGALQTAGYAVVKGRYANEYFCR